MFRQTYSIFLNSAACSRLDQPIPRGDSSNVITSMVVMVIGNNLARAFALVGAMSIIRFRTVVKDTKDTAFVFFALASGLAAGTSSYFLAAA